MESLRTFFNNFTARMKAPDLYDYKGWLVSDKFHKRYFAFMGYTFLAVIGIEIIRVFILYVMLFFKQGA